MIYAKTVKGELAAFDRTTSISANLKTVLLKVNGRAESAFIIAQLSEISDVQAMLDSLERAGLIQQHVSAKSAGPTEPNKADSFGGKTEQIDGGADTLPVVEPGSQPEIIRDVSEAMADFILQYLPSLSFSLLLELEAVRNLPQFEMLIDKFEPMALRVGPAGEELIKASRQALSTFSNSRSATVSQL